jgi:hypothetical protein
LRKLTFGVALFALVSTFAYTTASARGVKTVVCHRTAEEAEEPGGVTIEVSENAVPAHLAHGDVVGACAVVE